MARGLLVGLLILILLVGGGLVYASPLLRTATGYAAHNACAVEFVAGRGSEAAADDLPANPLVPYLRTEVDVSDGMATTSLLGLFGQQAFHTTGLGCTLADERPDLELVSEDAPSSAAWPLSDPDDAQAVDAAVAAMFAENDPEGRVVGTRAVVVVVDGQIVAERYADGFDAATPQLGWSMAKSVTSLLVGRAALAGQIGLDETELLPEWREDPRGDITLEDLLRMRSGLQWDEAYALGSTITEMLYLRDDMGGFAAAQPNEHDHGVTTQYSSGTTNIICDVLHDRTVLGPEMADDLLFAPLGMASAVLEPDASGGSVCSSYLWATARDWARVGQFALQDGVWEGERLLPEGWITETTTVEQTDMVQSPSDGNHAAHWWANVDQDGEPIIPELPADTYWASGHDGQRVFVIPSADVVVVRMGFTPDIPSAELGYGPDVAAILSALQAG